MNITQPPALLTERDLAQRWNISTRTLQNARVTGSGIRFIKIGRSVRYQLSDVQEFELKHLHSSTSEKRQ